MIPIFIFSLDIQCNILKSTNVYIYSIYKTTEMISSRAEPSPKKTRPGLRPSANLARPDGVLLIFTPTWLLNHDYEFGDFA